MRTAREELLDVAQRAFAERGFEATGMRDITDQAGVAHGMVRHHFGSKNGLWRAVVDRAVDRYRRALVSYATAENEHPRDVRAATRAAVHAFLTVNAQHPDLLRLTLHDAPVGLVQLAHARERRVALARGLPCLLGGADVGVGDLDPPGRAGRVDPLLVHRKSVAPRGLS